VQKAKKPTADKNSVLIIKLNLNITRLAADSSQKSLQWIQNLFVILNYQMNPSFSESWEFITMETTYQIGKVKNLNCLFGELI